MAKSAITSHYTVLSACPNCGKPLDAATNTQDGEIAAPSPGSVGVCFYCHHLMVYGDDLQLRNPTPDEMLDIAGDKDILEAMKVLAGFKEWERRGEVLSRSARKRSVVRAKDRKADRKHVPQSGDAEG